MQPVVGVDPELSVHIGEVREAHVVHVVVVVDAEGSRGLERAEAVDLSELGVRVDIEVALHRGERPNTVQRAQPLVVVDVEVAGAPCQARQAVERAEVVVALDVHTLHDAERLVPCHGTNVMVASHLQAAVHLDSTLRWMGDMAARELRTAAGGLHARDLPEISGCHVDMLVSVELPGLAALLASGLDFDGVASVDSIALEATVAHALVRAAGLLDTVGVRVAVVYHAAVGHRAALAKAPCQLHRDAVCGA
mmetsp:Transcript_20931/g.71310  ORF Transcript_20931/g.71310 Transcript_20931/m.71310 type:complete len:251 (-) Transcript_20931:4153-4905(-)